MHYSWYYFSKLELFFKWASQWRWRPPRMHPDHQHPYCSKPDHRNVSITSLLFSLKYYRENGSLPDQWDVPLYLSYISLPLNLSSFPQPLHYMVIGPPLSDLLNSLHGLNGLIPKISAVFHWDIPTLFKLECGVNSQLLARSLTVSFGPFGFTRVLLLFESSVAFWTAEPEDL